MENQQVIKAIKLLEQNKIVILPTDTIYGLSAIAKKENEIKINKIKQADINKPLIILISDVNEIKKFNIDINDEIIDLLNSSEPTTVIIGEYSFRLIKREDIKEIIQKVGPIFSTSVNIHGLKPFKNEKDLKEFNNEIDVFWIGDLSQKPSRIFNYNSREWIR